MKEEKFIQELAKDHTKVLLGYVEREEGYYPIYKPGARQVGCTRCNRKWAMHDNTRSFIDWDGELESMYRSFGEWK